MKENTLSLRPYLEKIETACSGLKKDELIRLVVRLAGDHSPDMRQQFLDKLQQYLSLDGKVGKRAEPDEEKLLHDDLQSLRQSILDRIKSIEDGSYWDEPDEDDWEIDYYDDDPDILSESHKTELAAFFDDAGEYFLQNRLPESRKLYEVLFDLVGEINRYGLIPDIEVDLREAHARYCRTVFTLSDKDDRVDNMLAALAVTTLDPDFDNIQGSDLALLQDVIDAQVGTLPDMQEFLAQWEKALAKKGHTPERLARLRLETACMRGGSGTIAKLVRSWGNKQPLGYVVWLQHLDAAHQWEDIREAAIEALNILPMSPERRYAAVNLVRAGHHMGNDDLVLEGRREAFRSSLDENDLLLLLDEANRLDIREKEIAWSLDVLQNSAGKVSGAKRLQAILFLMSGDLDSVAGLCKNEKVYGWSAGSPGALFFCALLYCMAGKRADRCVLLDSMLTDYTQTGYYFDEYCHNAEKPATTFAGEIKKGLPALDITQEKFTEYIPQTLKYGEKRVEYIVSNKYRNAYGRAASVLGAMAEMHVARGDALKARKLVHTFYFEKFNRFAAFRTEVRAALAKSPLLKEVQKLLEK